MWDKVAPAFVACLEKTPSYFTVGELWTWCRGGSAFLILLHDETDVYGGSVWHFEGDRFVCLILAGRESDEWIKPLFDAASIVARNGGAKCLRAAGRRGLGPKLRKHLPVKIIRHTYEVGL